MSCHNKVARVRHMDVKKLSGMLKKSDAIGRLRMIRRQSFLSTWAASARVLKNELSAFPI